jgi:hypothetical protein
MKDTVKDLCDRMALLHIRFAVVFGTPRPANPLLVSLAEALEAGLRAADPDAIAKVRGVVDPGDLSGTGFWATPLGRLLFAAGGYGQQTCTQTVAAAVLDCSRQWVSAMVAEHKLAPAAERGVYVEELRGVLQARLDRLVK